MASEEEECELNDVIIIQKENFRNLVAFWLFGLCNNFGYVVMLSAAFDILASQKGVKQDGESKKGFHCNKMSTGLVLLADILPTLFIKLVGPFYMQRIAYRIRVAAIILLAALSLVTVAFSPNEVVSLLGVVFASLSSGAGEITFLSFSAHFQKTVVSTWSSGTGMAGVAGSLSYAGLRQIGFSSRNTLLLLLLVPSLFALAFWVILVFPNSLTENNKSKEPLIGNGCKKIRDKTKNMSLFMKLNMIKPLFRYMVPLFIVYLAEYTINQGLFELLYYKIWLSQSSQYRWFQVVYQIGVFLSRSSVNLFRIQRIYIPAILQWFVMIFILLEVYFTFIPSFWITIIIILFEGLLGGSVYVNAFYLIAEEVEPDFKEFSMGVASISDSAGITIAGFIVIPIHNALCNFKML